jgi:hypothetical protein
MKSARKPFDAEELEIDAFGRIAFGGHVPSYDLIKGCIDRRRCLVAREAGPFAID